MRRLMVLLALVVALSPSTATADDPNWEIEIDNDQPFVGDIMQIELTAMFIGVEYSYVVMEVVNSIGKLVHNDLVQINRLGEAFYEWEIPLSMEPGEYLVRFRLTDRIVASVVVELIFDELDYMSKRVILLEDQLGQMMDYEFQTRQNANAAYELSNHFIRRWGIFAIFISLLNVAILLMAGPELLLSIFKKYMPPEKKVSFWDRAFGDQTDGNLTLVAGHEDMIKDIPEHAQGFFCTECKTWVRPQHRHGRRVKPLRVIKAVRQ